MRCINNIATRKKIFKLYGGDYKLKPYNINDTIPELIAKYKINNNATLKDLSDECSYSISYLSNVENGTISPSKNLIDIIYNLTVGYVLI